MSFGGGGFGGFGQTNNQATTGFGGFGANNNNNTNTGTGFGSTNTGGGFGSTNTGGGMFGSNNNATGGGFGAAAGGFGANTGSTFGAKPAFGAAATTTGGGLFGGSSTNNTTTNTGFGGFGATNNANTANNAASPFGGGAAGGVFGSANKTTTGFGATSNTGSSLFGGGGNTTTASTGFGGGFGASTNLAGSNDPPGTGTTPFQAFTEKEPNSSTGQSNAFQNLLFQDPYKKWSAEELRLADYVQGRRHGNASGTGAFGVSSGFGGGAFGASNNTAATTGFGSTPNAGGGMFGSNPATNTATNTGFGASTTGGFGGQAAGGGLFGAANKPAGGGLFGGTTQTAQPTGGLFGGTAAAGGFGATNNTGFGAANTNNAGGGLFGSNTQPKPAGTGFSFGNSTASTTSGFGATPSAGFGATNNTNTAASGGLFGGNNSTQAAGGLFGNPAGQQQQNTNTGFGSALGQTNQTQQAGGLFGNPQNKPATGGLFGGTGAQAGGGLFGGNTPQQNNTGFGASNTASAGGGLFGPKPAAGGGLFGGTTTTPNASTGGGLFGGMGANNQTQQTGGTGLFGATNNNQQKPGGLFGGSTQSTGGGLFGGSTQSTGGGLFGGSMNQQQQQNNGLGGSLLGNSQQGNNTPQGLTANLNDVSAYGTPSLFSNVGGNEVPNPGPLATPLNGNSKPRRSSILPMYKLAPASASRFATPQKRGFGFSYSNYGTPGGSPASSISSTPGTLGRGLLGSSSSGSLSKSMSTNNLRRSFNTEDSILAPGAFSSNSSTRWYGSTGSKKLVINRDIRSDLFSTPQKDKSAADSGTGSRKLSKRVSFDTSNVDAETETPVRGVLPAPEGTPDSQADETTPRQNRSTSENAGSKTPELEVNGKELAIVHEEDNSATPEAQSNGGFDNAPGQYWMSPAKDDLQNMNRMQRQRIDGFTVGRENVGQISFKIPVDLSSIDLEDLCGGIIQLEPRSATVYPVTAKKPPVGKGLNVPARISLEQSWPRGGRDKRVASDPKRFNKHVERLKRIPDTTFDSYDKDSGVWVFSVEHFTTYGLDDSDDEDDEEMSTAEPLAVSNLPEPQAMALDASTGSDEFARQDDAFDVRQHRGLPGAFDEQEDLYVHGASGKQSFLGVSSADSAPNDVRLSLEIDNTVDMGEEYDLSDDEDTTRSLVGQHLAAEHDDTSSEGDPGAIRGTPGGILRARMRAMKDSVGPVRLEVADGDDWMEMLRKTVSPVKRDRHLLRELNDSPSKQTGTLVTFDDDQEEDPRKSLWGKSVSRKDKADGFAASTQRGMDKGRGFATSIDLMNSLFEKPKPKPARQNLRASVVSKGFPQWPYERQDKNLTIDEAEKAYHDASRPTWGPDETLVVTTSLDAARARRSIRDTSGLLTFQRSGIQTDRQDLRLAKFSTESSKKYLISQDRLTDIRIVDDVPMAELHASNLKDVFHHQDMNDPANVHEKRVWELASILFDDVDAEYSSEQSMRKAKLSEFWTNLVDQAASTSIGLAGSSEEKAVACLAGHRITEACKHLLDGKNFRLGTLVPLIGTSDAAKRDMKDQIRAWHDSKMLSEFSEAIRTICELLSGNVCVCEGMKGVPVEDRMDSFVISKKFGLDWRQSFGLRLWYAISKQDDIAAAVKKFKDDIAQDKEDSPRPWYAEQGILPLWNDVDARSRQDLLWGLLQLYADKNANLEAILRPENSQLSPLDMRLCWQLSVALVSTGTVSYGSNGAQKADAATISYAAQLTSAGEWLEAVFVLLHIRDPVARKKAIQDHICRHAGLIGPESADNFGILIDKFRIPASWVWEALALYMRSVKKDAPAEVQCLLRAGSFAEAHRVLVQQVAPSAIIERDYASLSSLISQFEGRQSSITDWPLGGEIYGHFLTLVQHRSKGETASPALLDRLLAGLNAMNEDAPEAEIVRFAAVSDMADETAREIVRLTSKKQDIELRSRILNLPLTQDRLLAYSVDLSMDRYREVMSH